MVKQTAFAQQRQEQYFDLIWGQGRFLDQLETDTIPIMLGKSGSMFIGAGISIDLLPKRMGLRFQPGLTWTHIRYAQTPGKSFPSPYTDYEQESQLITYASLPIGLFANLSQDRKGKPGIFVEAGAYLGYKIGSRYKTRRTNNRDQQVKEITRGLPDLQTYRYGLYAEIGYQKAAVQLNYRLSDIFTPFRSNPDNSPSAYKNPTLSAYEIGLVLIL